MIILRLIAASAVCGGLFGANLVINGDFSAGNTGFTSAYTYVAPAGGAMFPPSVYTITPEHAEPHRPSSKRRASYFDHTSGDATGSFMAINGATVSGLTVWEETLAVAPGTDYFFSAWISSWVSTAPAELQFSINDVLIGSPFSAPSTTGVWSVFESNWNSGSSTSAKISIVDLNTVFGGNDYALDDIAFSETSVIDGSVPEPGYFVPAGLILASLFVRRRLASRS